MPRITLSDQERQTLEALVACHANHAIRRCAQALLWLDAGATVAKVTKRLGVCRHTIYKWRQRYQSYSPDITAWLTQHLHHGQYRPLIVLSDAERKTLEHLVAHATEVAVVHRAQALLWLNAGEKVSEVATRIRVDRETIAAWMRRFRRSSFPDFMVWLTERLQYSRPRPLFILNAQERRALEALVAHAIEAAAIVRRAHALLWLHTGENVSKVAQRLRVSRCTIYNWVQSFQDTPTSDIRQRLAASLPHDRSQTVRDRLAPLIRAVIDHDPRELGYHATVWTATLLSQYLWKEHGITASCQRINHLLRRLNQQGHAAWDHATTDVRARALSVAH